MGMATPELCERAIRQMLRSYPPRMNETTTEYIASLMTVLVGKPEQIVRDLAHPEIGILARCKFLPTVADVQEWMKPRLIAVYSRDQRERQIEDQRADRRDEPSEEDRERVLQAYRRGKQALVAKSEEWKKGFGKPRKPSQRRHTLDELNNTDLLRETP